MMNNKYTYLQFNSIQAGTQIKCRVNAYLTCLVTNDAWHAYDVIRVYKINHGAGRVSYFTKPAIPID